MADLEDGLFGCTEKYCPNIPTVQHTYLVAMLKGRSGGTFALKQGDAQSGTLQTIYDGARPKGYTVMKKQGAIILGIGGDNSNSQFAVLALYDGQRVGVEVSRETWTLAQKYWADSQNDDGSWGYVPGDSGTGSMTCAGIGGLAAGMAGSNDEDVEHGTAIAK